MVLERNVRRTWRRQSRERRDALGDLCGTKICFSPPPPFNLTGGSRCGVHRYTGITGKNLSCWAFIDPHNLCSSSRPGTYSYSFTIFLYSSSSENCFFSSILFRFHWGSAISPCHDRVKWEMYLEAVIRRDWRCTWRPKSSEFGDNLGGHIHLRLKDYLETVDLEAVDLESVNLELFNLEAVKLEVVNLEAFNVEAVILEAVNLEAINLVAVNQETVNQQVADLEAVDRERVESGSWDLIG